MKKTAIHLPEHELAELRRVAERSGRSVSSLVRQAVRERWLRVARDGPVALWDGEPRRPSAGHDSIYDER